MDKLKRLIARNIRMLSPTLVSILVKKRIDKKYNQNKNSLLKYKDPSKKMDCVLCSGSCS